MKKDIIEEHTSTIPVIIDEKGVGVIDEDGKIIRTIKRDEGIKTIK